MEITRAQAPAAANGAGEAGERKGTATAPTLGYDSFLKLLIAQIQNQDPLEPTASSDYVAQLATFSQVEKSVQMNERMSELLATSRLQQAESLLGRTVTSADGSASGLVSAVRIAGAEVVVTLAGGNQIVVGDGTTIS